MAGPLLFDRVKDTTATTGTGTVTLANSAPSGYRTFGSVLANGDTCYYVIAGGSEWEVGLGTYSTTGPTLARTSVLASSNSNAAVNFSAGTKDVFLTVPADFLSTLLPAGTPTHAALIVASVGPSGAQQHTVPAVASDTYALLAAAQTLTNKTLTAFVVTSQAAPSAAIGKLWYDSTQQALGVGAGQSGNAVNGMISTVLYTSTANASVATATTATLIGSGVGTLTLPANFLVAGKTLRLKAKGYITTTAAASTLIFLVKLGATTVANTNNGTALAPVSSMTAKPWEVEVDITCRTTGASGTVMAVGYLRFVNSATVTLTTANTVIVLVCSGTTPGAVTVDTTASKAVDFQVTDAGTGSTVVCTNFSLEVLN